MSALPVYNLTIFYITTWSKISLSDATHFIEKCHSSWLSETKFLDEIFYNHRADSSLLSHVSGRNTHFPTL